MLPVKNKPGPTRREKKKKKRNSRREMTGCFYVGSVLFSVYESVTGFRFALFYFGGAVLGERRHCVYINVRFLSVCAGFSIILFAWDNYSWVTRY